MHRSGDPAARVAALERGATVLRHLGLGRAVDAVARRFGSRLGHFEAELNGLRLGGDRVGHLYYARELMAEDRRRISAISSWMRSIRAPRCWREVHISGI